LILVALRAITRQNRIAGGPIHSISVINIIPPQGVRQPLCFE
jgi:hypothetical protein